MLKVRVITAVAGIAIAIIAIFFGGALYNGLLTALALLGWREFTKMFQHKRLRMPILLGYLIVLLTLLGLSTSFYSIAIGIPVIFLIGSAILFTFASHQYTLSGLSTMIFGIFYLLVGFSALMMLRNESLYMGLSMPFTSEMTGILVLWLLLLTTWASDTFAYFAGRAFGKRKIVPSISPNKTLEGFLGGFIGCSITGVLYGFITGIPLEMGVVVGILTGVFAPLGDLFESKLKRYCDVKDSGVLLPGHGGVLDRFDSLLFTAPLTVVYLLMMYL